MPEAASYNNLSYSSEQLGVVSLEQSLEAKKNKIMQGGTVLIFGQGPVITEPEERLNYWSEDLAESAAILKKFDKNVNHFVVMGGKTGGSGYKSEAGLIAEKMEKFGVNTADMMTEEKSNDTIENIVNFLNLFDTVEDIDTKKFSILCAPYHSARTQILLQLFKVPVDQVFQSTEILRFSARVPDGEKEATLDSSKWDDHLLQTIDDKIDMNDPDKYSFQQSPQEQRDVSDRFVKDDLWTRELLEFPEKWLPYVAELTDGHRIEAILTQFEILYPGMLKEKYHIGSTNNLDEAALDNIKSKLSKIPTYKGLSQETVDSWVIENKKDGWPDEEVDRLDTLLAMRKTETTS